MDKEEYFQKELDALPEACDVHVVFAALELMIRATPTRASQSRTSEKRFFAEWAGMARKRWMRPSMYVSVATAIVGNQATTRPTGTRRHSSCDGQTAEEKCAEEK